MINFNVLNIYMIVQSWPRILENLSSFEEYPNRKSFSSPTTCKCCVFWIKTLHLIVTSYYCVFLDIKVPVSSHYNLFFFFFLFIKGIKRTWWCRNAHQWDARPLHSNNRCLKIGKYKKAPSKGVRCGAGQIPSDG